MSKGRNVAKGGTKSGIKVGETGSVYFSRRYGRVDMHVSEPGGLLAVATEDGGTRPADPVDIDRLKKSGHAVAIGGIVPDAKAGDGPIRRVDVIDTRSAPKPLHASEMMTSSPSIGSAGDGERHGPPTLQERADHIATTFAFDTVVHESLSARCAYGYYLAALRDMNRRHRTARIEPMSTADFDRLVAVAGFIMEAGLEPPTGATIH